MTWVELFFHCDQHGCDAHAYVDGPKVDGVSLNFDKTVTLPKAIPPGWQRTNTGKDYCAAHKRPEDSDEATMPR
jgi:hypothetical protein